LFFTDKSFSAGIVDSTLAFASGFGFGAGGGVMNGLWAPLPLLLGFVGATTGFGAGFALVGGEIGFGAGLVTGAFAGV